MKTKISNGEKTYWVGMTETQMKTMRFAIGALLLSKETGLPIEASMNRTDHRHDPALMWETIETFEKGLDELAKA